MKKLKLAFLGGGINSAVGRAHKTAIEMDGKFELVSGCFSRNESVNTKTAIEYGVCLTRCYKSLSALILNEKNNIDAICILTPTPNHKDEVLLCLENNIKVICEKSLAASVDEVLEIKQSLQRNNGFLVVTYNYTGYPMLRELKKLIEIGRLGKINQVHIEMPQEGFARLDKEGNPSQPQQWRLADNSLSTLSLDLGVHTHNITSFLTGEHPLEVVALQSSLGNFKNIIDNCLCLAKYTNNVVANIWFSKASLGHRNGLKVRIYGDKASAEWYQLDPENLFLSDHYGSRFIIDRASSDVITSIDPRYNRFKSGHPAGFIEAFANYYCDLHNSILGKRDTIDEYVFGIDEALNGIKMLEAIMKSDNLKEWVEV